MVVLFLGVQSNIVFLIVLLQQCRPVDYFLDGWLGGRALCAPFDVVEWYSDRYAVAGTVTGLLLFTLLYWVMRRAVADQTSIDSLKAVVALGFL